MTLVWYQVFLSNIDNSHTHLYSYKYSDLTSTILFDNNVIGRIEIFYDLLYKQIMAIPITRTWKHSPDVAAAKIFFKMKKMCIT